MISTVDMMVDAFQSHKNPNRQPYVVRFHPVDVIVPASYILDMQAEFRALPLPKLSNGMICHLQTDDFYHRVIAHNVALWCKQNRVRPFSSVDSLVKLYDHHAVNFPEMKGVAAFSNTVDQIDSHLGSGDSFTDFTATWLFSDPQMAMLFKLSGVS